MSQRIISHLCLPICCASTLMAQLFSGSLSGPFRDPAGATVPEASVILTDSEHGTTNTVSTDRSGRYLLRSLPPGTYSMEIEAKDSRLTGNSTSWSK